MVAICIGACAVLVASVCVLLWVLASVDGRTSELLQLFRSQTDIWLLAFAFFATYGLFRWLFVLFGLRRLLRKRNTRWTEFAKWSRAEQRRWISAG
jgi:hypothetical protein